MDELSVQFSQLLVPSKKKDAAQRPMRVHSSNRISAYDLVACATGMPVDKAQRTYETVLNNFPSSIPDLNIEDLLFDGKYQRATPSVDAKGAVILLLLLPGKRAGHFRSASADVIVAHLQGDRRLPSAVKEIPWLKSILATPEDQPTLRDSEACTEAEGAPSQDERAAAVREAAARDIAVTEAEASAARLQGALEAAEAERSAQAAALQQAQADASAASAALHAAALEASQRTAALEQQEARGAALEEEARALREQGREGQGREKALGSEVAQARQQALELQAALEQAGREAAHREEALREAALEQQRLHKENAKVKKWLEKVRAEAGTVQATESERAAGSEQRAQAALQRLHDRDADLAAARAQADLLHAQLAAAQEHLAAAQSGAAVAQEAARAAEEGQLFAEVQQESTVKIQTKFSRSHEVHLFDNLSCEDEPNYEKVRLRALSSTSECESASTSQVRKALESEMRSFQYRGIIGGIRNGSPKASSAQVKGFKMVGSNMVPLTVNSGHGLEGLEEAHFAPQVDSIEEFKARWTSGKEGLYPITENGSGASGSEVNVLLGMDQASFDWRDTPLLPDCPTVGFVVGKDGQGGSIVAPAASGLVLLKRLGAHGTGAVGCPFLTSHLDELALQQYAPIFADLNFSLRSLLTDRLPTEMLVQHGMEPAHVEMLEKHLKALQASVAPPAGGEEGHAAASNGSQEGGEASTASAEGTSHTGNRHVAEEGEGSRVQAHLRPATLIEKAKLFRRELGLEEGTVREAVEAAAEQLGVKVAGRPLVEVAEMCCQQLLGP